MFNFKLRQPVVLEYKYVVNRQTNKTQIYKIMINSATCFGPIESSSGGYLKHIKEVHTSLYGREISLPANYVTIQFIYLQLMIQFCRNSY